MAKVLVGNLKGPKGDKGDPGPQGPPGDGPIELEEHINSPTPHPAYDEDISSLTLIFENGLV